jgi:hypothetical protein
VNRIVPASIHSTAIGLAVAAGALLGCSAPDRHASPTTTSVRDSGGTRIVEVGGADWARLPVWRIDNTPAAEIRAEGEPWRDPLYGVTGAVRLRDGRIAVANGRVPAIQVFGSEGEFVSVVGREGLGPGEFSGIDSLLPYRGDSMAVFDAVRQHVMIFGGDGTWGRSIPLPANGGRARLLGVFPDGALLYSTDTFSTATGVWRDSATYVRVSSDGTVADTLGRWPTEERYSIQYQGRPIRGVRPFGASTWAVPDGETLHVGTGEAFVIETVALHGRPIRRVGAPARGALLTDTEIAQYERERLERIQGTRAYPLIKAVLASGRVPYPERLPAHGRLIVDSEDHLWVERLPLPGDTVVSWFIDLFPDSAERRLSEGH